MRWLFSYVTVYILPLPRQAVEESRKKYERLLSATPDTSTNCDSQELIRRTHEELFRDYGVFFKQNVKLDCNALWDPQLLLPAISYAAFKHAGSLL
jgi:hypothetical protein